MSPEEYKAIREKLARTQGGLAAREPEAIQITVSIPPHIPHRGADSVTVERGQRARHADIPTNMRENFAADEERAWSHSDLAGVLWEIGFRASRAIALAENKCCNTEKTR